MRHGKNQVGGLAYYGGKGLVLMGLVLLFGCTMHVEEFPMKKDNTRAQSFNAISKVRMQSSLTEKLEALSAVSYDGEKFTAKAISHGCTESTDFNIEHEVVEGRCRVAIVRSKPDMCRRAPMLAEISIEWSQPTDCANLELVVENPVLVTNSHGTISKRVK